MRASSDAAPLNSRASDQLAGFRGSNEQQVVQELANLLFQFAKPEVIAVGQRRVQTAADPLWQFFLSTLMEVLMQEFDAEQLSALNGEDDV